jgi:predicted metal-binding membrane protein
MTVTATRDTPRMAYSVLERRATFVTAGVLLMLAGAAWWATARRSEDMTGMVQGLAQVGGAATFAMAAPMFLAMWVTMMVAMMFPTIAPIVLLHRLVIRRHGGGIAPTVTFVGGYLLVWAMIGLAPLAALVGSRAVTGDTRWVSRLAGGVLLLAGAYQFTRWKQTCLRACRTPLTFLSTHNFGHGLLGTMRAGISHGAYCLGCCWALMAVLFTVGLMNLAWMAAIAVVFLAEKNWKHGVALTKIVGTAVFALGVAVVAHPELLTSVAMGGRPAQMTPMT